MQNCQWIINITRYTLLAILLATLPGCGGKYQGTLSLSEFLRVIMRKKPMPPTTLIVSGENITVDSLIESPINYMGRSVVLGDYVKAVASAPTHDQFEQAARPAVQRSVEERIWNILLYQKAKSDAGDAKQVDEALDKAAQRMWREYVVEHSGNDAEATLILKSETGMSLKQFKDLRKREMLTQIHVANQMPHERPISHLEYVDYYNRMKEDYFLIKPKISMWIIDIQPDRLKLEDLTVDRVQQARLEAETLHARLEAGEDFVELARAHSHGYLARTGGLWKDRDPDSLAAPYDVLAQAAQTMDIGDTSAPIEASGHIFIMRLKAKQERAYQPLEDVQVQIENRIQADRRETVLNKLNAEISERAQVGKTDEFINYVLEEMYRRFNR